jgi:hypothetical protein
MAKLTVVLPLGKTLAVQAEAGHYLKSRTHITGDMITISTLRAAPMKNFNLKLDKLNGYIVEINAVDDRLSILVTQSATGRAWKATREAIEDALDIASKIVVEQILIAQMKEGDKP